MKNPGLYILIFFLFISCEASAQLNFTETNNGGFVQFGDMNGRSLRNEKYDPAIEGTPFINPDWADADLLTTGGQLVKNVKVKLNIESNELYYLDAANTTWIALDGKVKKISYINLISNENIPFVFQNGYPAFDNKNENYYYQVLCSGKISLLKKQYKNIEIFKNPLSGEQRKEFVEYSRYYVFSAAGMEPFKNSKEYLVKLMNDKGEATKQYLDENKINFKKIPDLMKLISFYNELK